MLKKKYFHEHGSTQYQRFVQMINFCFTSLLSHSFGENWFFPFEVHIFWCVQCCKSISLFYHNKSEEWRRRKKANKTKFESSKVTSLSVRIQLDKKFYSKEKLFNIFCVWIRFSISFDICLIILAKWWEIYLVNWFFELCPLYTHSYVMERQFIMKI